jgi:NAD+-dependent protein deacetylase sirtuin 4
MMRVSVPTITTARSSVKHSPPAAIERISEFLAPGNAAVLTGAGVSVDSGIRAYRGKDGRYMNPNYRYASVSLDVLPS